MVTTIEQIRNKLKSRNGAGEFISFSVSATFLLLLLLMSLSICGWYYSKERLETVSQQAARLALVAGSLEEAEKITTSFADEQLTDWRFVPGSAKCDVRYKNGSKTEWEKGAILEVEVSARLRGVPDIFPRERYASTTVMLEYVADID